MKKIKIFILVVISLFILSGCAVQSKVTMNYDGTVEEKVELATDYKNLGTTKEEAFDYIDAELESYKAVLDFREYNYEVASKKNNVGVVISKKYKNICEYFQDTAINQYLYEHISCTETDEYYEIKSDTPHIDYCADCMDWPRLDDAKLLISLPIEAQENNADSVNDKTYIWEFNKSTPESKTIILKISKSDILNNKVIEEKHMKKLSTIKVIGIVIGIFILIVVGLVLYKKYQNNKLEY